MKVSGFTFIRNAIKYDYPVVEAIRSIIPLCDEIVVAVGNSEDETLKLIRDIDPKVRIIETIWDDTLREGGRVLAEETNKAFTAIANDSDWAFYIQGDEVLHERYIPAVREAMEKFKKDKNVDGLLFHYKHFFGSYDFFGSSSSWYKNEIRIVKNRKDIFSYLDAQGFRKLPNDKLNVKAIEAYIYHYGWVKPPDKQQQKQETFHKLWHGDEWVEKNIQKKATYQYEENISQLEKFEESHPIVMQKRINEKNWKFEYDISFNKVSFKEKFKFFCLKYLGKDLSYRNYHKV